MWTSTQSVGVSCALIPRGGSGLRAAETCSGVAAAENDAGRCVTYADPSQFSTNLTVSPTTHEPMLIYEGGSKCPGNENERASTVIRVSWSPCAREAR